jgi:hypothetical protein
MTDDERLERLLRSALRPVATPGPSRDLWPLVVERSRSPVAWSWLDVGLAVVVATVLLLFPNWLWLLAYHL